MKLDQAKPPRGLSRGEGALHLFEIFVGAKFCELEAISISQTLQCANDVVGGAMFDWRYVSETAGLVTGASGMLVRAEPMVQDHDLADVLVVVGGRSGAQGQWFPRLRQMTRLSRACVLLSDAATHYITQTKSPVGNVTTHWRDALSLIEQGDHPKLTNSLAEKSGPITTAAGRASTIEMVINLIAPHLSTADIAELSNRLMLSGVRKPHADQPNDITTLPVLSDGRIRAAVKAMEETLETPLNIYELAKTIGVSTRHLERMFKEVFDQTPARFYKQLRTKRARALIEETQMPMMEIAIATGFGSSGSMNEAVKREFGVTATKMRARLKTRES